MAAKRSTEQVQPPPLPIRSYEVIERLSHVPPLGSGPWSNVGNETEPDTREDAELQLADALRDHDFFDDHPGRR